MAPTQLAHVNNFVSKVQKSSQSGTRFADVLAQKKPQDVGVSANPLAFPHGQQRGINKIFTNILSNHEASAKAMNSSLIRKEYTPEKLLKSQFNISMFLLREQMYTKTAELSANTLKNFTQMQV